MTPRGSGTTTSPADDPGAAPELAEVEDDGRPVPSEPLPDGWDVDGHLRALFDQTPTACSLIDLRSRRVYANPAYLHLFGYDVPGAPPLDATRITREDDQERTGREFRQLVAGSIARIDRNKPYVRADGSTFWGHLDATLLRGPDGAPWAILNVCRDVTAELEAEAKLAGSEARLRALVEHAADAIVVVEAGGRLTFATPSADAIAGFAVTEQPGFDVFQVVHPDDHDVVARSFMATASTPGMAAPLQFRLLRPDGQVRHVEAVATNLLDDPAVRGVVINVRDLSDRTEAQTALAISERRFRRMIENISDTVTLVDRQGRTIPGSGDGRGALGYPPGTWIDRDNRELVHSDDQALMALLLDEVLASPGKEVTHELRIRAPDGGWAVVESTAVNLLDDPAVDAIVVTSRDITARKQVETELAAARDQAVRALEARTEFVASVSHELRTPIHGILGLAELLATSTAESERTRLARSIRRATESLKMVLDDLLDFTKVEAGRLELVDEVVSTAELVDDVLSLFELQAQERGTELVASVAPDVPGWVRTDRFRFRQVLANLVSNAVKFTERGRVTLEVRTESGDGGSWLCTTVSDTGIGMSDEDIATVFEPFSQAARSTAGQFGGTGLGLTISTRLVELMGGSLQLTSRQGVGTVAVVRLPLRAAAAQREAPTPSTSERAGTGARRTVMVVEDNPVNSLLVQRQLMRLGHQVVMAGSGEELLERFGGVRPDLVALDWHLPGIDGLEAVRRLRELEREMGRDPTPVVAMTASALPGDRARCLEAGMDDFLAKPVGLAALGAVLDRWLPTAATAPPTPRRAPEVVDHAVLARLVEELDDPDVVRNFVATYRRELPLRVERIRDAVVRGDREELVAAAHVLSSTSAAVGADGLARRCARLEADGRDPLLPLPLAGDGAGPLWELVDEARAVDLALADEQGLLSA